MPASHKKPFCGGVALEVVIMLASIMIVALGAISAVGTKTNQDFEDLVVTLEDLDGGGSKGSGDVTTICLIPKQCGSPNKAVPPT